jgi:pyruvate dehydrogenase E1 component beta subunit
MSGGQLSVPLVVRMTTGAGRQLAAQHSHSLEGWYAHIPGITVVAPGTVDDARALLLAALREPDPVFVFEHASLYTMEGEVDESSGPGEIGRAIVRREGTDLSIVTYGGSLPKAMAAADLLAAAGITAEVVDLRTLRPLDTATVLASVARTHRALVVDEGWRTGSFAAEVSAQIMEGGFYDLDGPVQRLCSAEVPIPYAKQMEDAALPQPATIAAAARAMLRRDG